MKYSLESSFYDCIPLYTAKGILIFPSPFYFGKYTLESKNIFTISFRDLQIKCIQSSCVYHITIQSITNGKKYPSALMSLVVNFGVSPSNIYKREPPKDPIKLTLAGIYLISFFMNLIAQRNVTQCRVICPVADLYRQ